MFKVRVIPCLDVKDGRVVKGVNFVDLRDAGDPVEMARAYDLAGADELVFLDITASSGDRETTYDVVRRTAEQVFIPLTVGGGVREVDDIDKLLRAGADKVGVNTAALARPELLREASQRFGAQCVVISVDARRCRDDVVTASGWEVTTHGGRRSTGLDALEFVLAGASAVSVGTVTFNDPSAPARIGRELAVALAERGFESLTDAVGYAHRAHATPSSGGPVAAGGHDVEADADDELEAGAEG